MRGHRTRSLFQRGAWLVRLGKDAPASRHALTLFHCRGEQRQATINGFRRTDLVLTIRMSRIGKRKKPFYRVLVIERTRLRDGRVREAEGTSDPLQKPAEISLDADRNEYRIGFG